MNTPNMIPDEWFESNLESSDDFAPSGMEDAVSDAADSLYLWSLYLLTLSQKRTTRTRVAALKPHYIDQLLAAREQLNEAIRRLRKDFARSELLHCTGFASTTENVESPT